jgi:hypothetical protein
MNSALPPGARTLAFFQHCRRMFRCFQPVHDHQPVHRPGGNRPLRLGAEHRHIRLTHRPGHHPLLAGHQAYHPPRAGQIGAQQRYGKAKANHRLPLDRRPERHHLITHRPLRRPTDPGAIIEIPQLKNIKMHCARSAVDEHSTHT